MSLQLAHVEARQTQTVPVPSYIRWSRSTLPMCRAIFDPIHRNKVRHLVTTSLHLPLCCSSRSVYAYFLEQPPCACLASMSITTSRAHIIGDGGLVLSLSLRPSCFPTWPARPHALPAARPIRTLDCGDFRRCHPDYHQKVRDSIPIPDNLGADV